MATFHFHLVCPGCGKKAESLTGKRVPPPNIKCGDCLMDKTEVVEFKVVSVRNVTDELFALIED